MTAKREEITQQCITTDFSDSCKNKSFVESTDFDEAIHRLQEELHTNPALVNPEVLDQMIKLKSKLMDISGQYPAEKITMIQDFVTLIRSKHAHLTEIHEEKKERRYRSDKSHGQYLHGFSNPVVSLLLRALTRFLNDTKPDKKKFDPFLEIYQLYISNYTGTMSLLSPESKIWNTQLLNYLASYIRANTPLISPAHIKIIYDGLSGLREQGKSIFPRQNVTYTLSDKTSFTLDNVHPLTDAILKPMMENMSSLCTELQRQCSLRSPDKNIISEHYQRIQDQLMAIENISAVTDEELNTLKTEINNFLEKLQHNGTSQYSRLLPSASLDPADKTRDDETQRLPDHHEDKDEQQDMKEVSTAPTPGSYTFVLKAVATISKRKHEVLIGVGVLVLIAGIALLTATPCGAVTAALLSMKIMGSVSVVGGAALSSLGGYKLRLFGPSQEKKPDDREEPRPTGDSTSLP